MKIVIVYGGGKGLYGIERYLLSFLKNLDYSKFEVLFLSLGDWPLLDLLPKNPKITVFAFFGFNINKAAKSIEEEKGDLLYAHGLRSLIFSSFLKKRLNIPLIYTAHGILKNEYFNPVKQFIFPRIESFCLRYVDRVVAISKSVKQYLKDQGAADQKIEVVLSGVEILEKILSKEPLLARYTIDPSFKIVACVGRLEKPKGQEILLRAVPEILKQHPKTLFLFAGEGSQKENLTQIAKDLKVESNVRFAGFVKDSAEIYALSDIVVVPSLSEGFGLSATEAMSFGKPIVASDIGGIAEIIKDNVDGLLFRAGDTLGLASQISFLLQNQDQRDQLGNKAKERVAQNFSIENWIKNLEKIFLNLK